MSAVCQSACPLDPNAASPDKSIKIGIVGPCSAGKSTLIAALQERGIAARHIAQEHSYVPEMWRRLADPEILIYLDVSYQVSMQRRPMNLSPAEFSEQVHRLRDARHGADFYIHTDQLSIAEVLDQVLAFLNKLDNPTNQDYNAHARQP